jgi:HK97 family phage portal protein
MSLWRTSPRPEQRNLAALEVALRGRNSIQDATGSVRVDETTAMRQSAVWACVRLRADHMSTLPVDVFRDFDGIAVETNRPPIFEEPGGRNWAWHDWAWASQSDLDRTGNAVGIIREFNPYGLPRIIELANTKTVSVRSRDGVIKWRIDNKDYRPDQIWHERQFPVSGMILGLSPVAYAAWSIGEALSMQEFALKWFGQGGVPRARLRNTQKTLKPEDALTIKERWRGSVASGDLFVTGNDWEYNLIQAEKAGMEFIEGRRMAIPDIARFFGCPADMIDGASSGGSANINYANITQKNLQFLVHNLGPAIIRRETNWTRGLLPAPRYVKLNTDALLRMDPQNREQTIRSQLESRQITVTEARALSERPKFTAAQENEVLKFFPAHTYAAPQLPQGGLTPPTGPAPAPNSSPAAPQKEPAK